MLDLVAQPNQEPQVVGCVTIDGTPRVIEAALKLPVLVRSVLGSVVSLSNGALFVVAIVDALRPIVGVQEIGPRDDRQNDKRLGLEARLRVVVDANGVCNGRGYLDTKLFLRGDPLSPSSVPRRAGR